MDSGLMNEDYIENVDSAWDNKGDILVGNDVWIGQRNKGLAFYELASESVPTRGNRLGPTNCFLDRKRCLKTLQNVERLVRNTVHEKLLF